jgi:hypothetical protein
LTWTQSISVRHFDTNYPSKQQLYKVVTSELLFRNNIGKNWMRVFPGILIWSTNRGYKNLRSLEWKFEKVNPLDPPLATVICTKRNSAHTQIVFEYLNIYLIKVRRTNNTTNFEAVLSLTTPDKFWICTGVWIGCFWVTFHWYNDGLH